MVSEIDQVVVVNMDMVTSQAIKVEISYAETVRKQLLKKKLLRTDLKILKDATFIYLPIINIADISNDIPSDVHYQICTHDFEMHPLKIHDYKELLSFPNDLKEILPTSFDVIGSIILIKLDDALLPYESMIGEALLKTHVHIDSVYRINPVKGELRTRSVSRIAGKNQKTTIHKEYGLFFEVDIEKTYFNPRLSNERHYVSQQVKSGEMILDMFTGVAPFPLMIARYANPKFIIAIDKNRDAVELAKKNLKRNRIDIDIRLICDDAKHVPVLIEECRMIPDRIIMNLPFHASDFFIQALQCIKEKAVIHFYTIGSNDLISEQIKRLNQIAIPQDFLLTIDKKREIKTYAPHEFYMGIDITAKKSDSMPT